MKGDIMPYTNKEKNVQISVVFVQYNPDYNRLFFSLYALIHQKEISFEIIIADDGSKIDYFDEISDFFQKHGFSNYLLHKNNSNVGTVKNFLSGIELSKGEYIFGYSPGDFLKDEYVLKDLFRFSVKHKAQCVFSKAVYYYNQGSEISVVSRDANPIKPVAFKWYMPQLLVKFSLFDRHSMILGAAFLRKRSYAIKYLKAIESTAKYVEDNTSALYSVMNGERIIYYDRIILWYETAAPKAKEVKSKWDQYISDDFSKTTKMIDQVFSTDPLYDFYQPNQNRVTRILKHPIISIINSVYKHLPTEKTPSSEELEQELTEYLKKTISCF